MYEQCPVKSQVRHCQHLVLREAVHIRTLAEYTKVSGNICLDMPNLPGPLHYELVTGQKMHDLILQFCKKLTSFVLGPLSCSQSTKTVTLHLVSFNKRIHWDIFAPKGNPGSDFQRHQRTLGLCTLSSLTQLCLFEAKQRKRLPLTMCQKMSEVRGLKAWMRRTYNSSNHKSYISTCHHNSVIES